MRITKSARAKLEKIFLDRMASLSFDEDRPTSTWSLYLESIGCRRVNHGCERPSPPRGFVVVEDPIWMGDYILIPMDIVPKILVLGLP